MSTNAADEYERRALGLMKEIEAGTANALLAVNAGLTRIGDLLERQNELLTEREERERNVNR